MPALENSKFTESMQLRMMKMPRPRASKQVVGEVASPLTLVRVEALSGVVDRDLEAVLEQGEVHVDEP